MRTDNVQMLTDTLHICEQGFYMRGGKRVNLKLSPDDMKVVRVFLPDEVVALARFKDFQHVHVIGRCGHGCENMDSFSLRGNGTRIAVICSRERTRKRFLS